MTSRRAAAKDNAATYATCVLALALGAWCVPALASNGLAVNSNDKGDRLSSLDVPAASLAREVIDPDIANPPGGEALNVPIESNATLSLDFTPRAEVIFQEIFEDRGIANAVRPARSDSGPPGSAAVPALINAKSVPVADKQDERNISEDAGARSAESSGVEPRLPGVSESDLLRFRRQMFRTDI